MKSNLAYAYDLDDPQTRREIFEDFLREPPKDDDELHWWIKTFCGYDIPRRPSGICAADHVAPFSFIADQFFERSTSSFGFANRNGGKTFMTALLNLLDMVFKPGVYIVLAGAVREQAAEGYRYLLELIGNEPLLAEMLAALPTMERTVLVNDSRIKITCATYSGLNGPHPTKLRWDEVELIHPSYIKEGLCLAGDTRVATRRGVVRLDEVHVGDNVWSWSEEDRAVRIGTVSWAGQTGVLDTVELEFSNGERLVCTPGHRILCESGEYEQAGWLAPGRRVRGAEMREVREAALAWTSAHDRPLRNLLARGEAPESPRPEMHGLWRRAPRQGEARRTASAALRAVLQELQSQVTHALSRLREATSACWTPAMLGLSLEASADSWRTDRFPEATRREHAEEAADTRGGLDDVAPRFARHPLRALRGAWDLGARLLADGRAGGDRSARCLLARQAEVTGARREEATAARGEGLHGDRGEIGRGSYVVELLRVSRGPKIPVHDLTVPGYHSFLANGVMVHNSMTVSHPRGYKAQDTFTSTRKVSAGTVQQLLDEKDERGLNIYNFCVWENLEKCSRKCRDPETGKMCPAYAKPDKDGNLKAICGILDGAAEPHGKAQLLPLGGFYKLDDFIRKCAIQDRLTLETQWFNYKPSGGALIYGDYFKDEPPFILTDSEARAILIRMETERNWMRTVGIDFGSNFAVAFWACDPMDQVWYKYHEIFWSPDQDLPLEFRARKIKEGDPLGWSARTMVWCDPAGKQQIIDLQNYRIDALPANNDVLAGIQFIKGRLEWRSQRGLPGLRYFPPSVNLGVDAEGKARIVGCRNSIVEMAEKYVHPQTKSGDVDRDKILKKNDHNCDADRYALFTSSVQGISNYRSRRLQGVW